MIKVPIALSIAGSDPSGGAGIQADLKTFCALGVYGMAVPTLLTVQNTGGVRSCTTLAAGLVRKQIEAILEDIQPDVIKIGAMGTAEIVMEVAAALEMTDAKLVIDPVIQSTSGSALLETSAVDALKSQLLHRAVLVTPNQREFEILSRETPIKTNILLTGGDSCGDIVEDILIMTDGNKTTWKKEKLKTPNSHGTGCTLSSAIAAKLAHGLNLEQACLQAIEWTRKILEASMDLKLGAGIGPLFHQP